MPSEPAQTEGPSGEVRRPGCPDAFDAGEPGGMAPCAGSSRAGSHVDAAAAGIDCEWAMDVWADAAWDVVYPVDALWPDIASAAVVFEDGTALLYTHGTPREVPLAEALKGMGRLDDRAVACLLRSKSEAVRLAAVGLLAELRRT